MPDLERLFRYDQWANREALGSVRAIPSPPARSLKLIGHIVGAEVLWHARLTGGQAALGVWPDLSPGQADTWLGDLDALWRKYLARVIPAGLSGRVAYRNTKGEAFASTVDDVLTHVVMHSAYHRGQIAADVRAAGHQPAYTDFIHAVRTGRVS
ncbi:MAG TPA: DinB family protein [Gemmatimonadales bacterium]|nr:DinB family protein [Gemmatimonadales bacterium]